MAQIVMVVTSIDTLAAYKVSDDLILELVGVTYDTGAHDIYQLLVSSDTEGVPVDGLAEDAGIATIKLTAAGGIHDFVFDGAYPGFQLEADGGGGSQSKKIDLKPGKYTFYCSITGHRAQGMEGTLTVK